MTDDHIRIFDNIYQNAPDREEKKVIFSSIMNMIREQNPEKAARYLKQYPEFLNIGENRLDFLSVGRFTTPFLVAASHNSNELLKDIINDPTLSSKVDWLTQSHCGQQVLAHAVVNKESDHQKQLETVKILLGGAEKALNKEDFKEFIFGGGVWGRTPLYNALVESENTPAATMILEKIHDKGQMAELREQRLQLNRPVTFYLHDKAQLNLALDGLTENEKRDYLSITDDVGSSALHWAKNAETAQTIMNYNHHLISVANYDGYTPAESLSLAGRLDAAQTVLGGMNDEMKDEIKEKIHAHAEKMRLQKSLAKVIKAVDKQETPSMKSVDLLGKKKNFDSLHIGTKAFLAKHFPDKFALSSQDKQEFNQPLGQNFVPPRGFENEFHMPLATEPAIKHINNILNKTLPEGIFSFGQDPEPSILTNNPTEQRVEINSPIIRNGKQLRQWYQLNDIAEDLGARKNATSGIHIHIGCKNELSRQDIGMPANNPVTSEEIQLAFLKTFLHAFTIARPAFDDIAMSGLRPDFHSDSKMSANVALHPKTIENFHLGDHKKPDQKAYTAYLQEVNRLQSFKQIPKFIGKIGREKYVTVAPPKDDKGTLEVRELKTRFVNEAGMNNQELKNIFNFINAMSLLTLACLQANPPTRGESYIPNLTEVKPKLLETAQTFRDQTIGVLASPATIKSPKVKAVIQRSRRLQAPVFHMRAKPVRLR